MIKKVHFEITFQRLNDKLELVDEYLRQALRILNDGNSHVSRIDIFNHKIAEANKRELLLKNTNHLVQLIRFMIKHNQLLKRGRVFQFRDLFNTYYKSQLMWIEELSFKIVSVITANMENKVRGELQWQQVSA
ncbi:hypothetical protein [Pseudoalteromonas sp. T1lg22]|uniref:hypothetical protein n=1 Tax=Pseudoalteromonas sp. T1lg22 TaxID=2077096 RepID=UPI000CF641A9|nr:hypothetical protein [Pseudoalteromonas sp. T1lg22]